MTTVQDPHALLASLITHPSETEWLEFKVGNFHAENVAKYVSGLANSCIFSGRDHGYLIYGVKDGTHEIVGTNVRMAAEKVGNENFLLWLAKSLYPKINVHHLSFDNEGKHVEMLVVDPGYQQPVRFSGRAFVRVDSSLQPLSNYPERERAIWAATSRFAFEQATSRAHLSGEAVLECVNTRTFFSLAGRSPQSASAAIHFLEQDGLVRGNNQNAFDVTNLLGLIAANDLKDWPGLEHKGVRLVQYADATKLYAIDDVIGKRGYAIGFANLISETMRRLNRRESMAGGIRRKLYDIPEDTVREIVANALIHQDLTAVGDVPIVEIFPDKVRVTNPGPPLVDTDHLIGTPSKSRNAKFADTMRQLGLCEKRGSGIDRALTAIEEQALPPPSFDVIGDMTIVTMFRPRRFAEMSKDERIRACFQHACLGYEKGQYMSNASLRARFGLSDKQHSQVSVVIREAIAANRIRPLDEDQAKRNARYVPYWV